MARAAGPLPRTRTSHSSCDVGVDVVSLVDGVADRAAWRILEEAMVRDACRRDDDADAVDGDKSEAD